jgi:hypothetical protein
MVAPHFSASLKFRAVFRAVLPEIFRPFVSMSVANPGEL